MAKRCCVPGCSARYDKMMTRSAGQSFFRLPPNREMLQQWLAMIQNPRLEGLTPKKLRSKTVCHRHFEDWCFTSIGDAFAMRRRLVWTALPTIMAVGAEAITESLTPPGLEPPEPDGKTTATPTVPVPVPQVMGMQKTQADPCRIVPSGPKTYSLGNVGLRLPENTGNVTTQNTSNISNSQQTVIPVPPQNPSIKKMADNNVETLARMNISVLENIQNKNVLTVPGVNARMSFDDIASLEDFHSDVPTILNVFSYPQEKWFSELSRGTKPVPPGKVDKEQEPICCGEKCKMCKGKLERFMRQNKQLKLEIGKLRKENAKLSKYDMKLLNETQRRLVEQMFRRKQVKARGYRYDPNLLNDTLQLRRISRPAYLFVKKKFHLPLPSDVSLRKYVATMNRIVEGVTDDGLVSGDEVENMVEEVGFDDVDHMMQDVDFNEVDDTPVAAADAHVETVEVVSSSLSTDEQTQHEAVEAYAVDVIASYSGEEMPLEVDLDQTYQETAEVVSSNCGENVQIPLEGDTAPLEAETLQVISPSSISDGQVPLVIDQTSKDLLSACSLNYSSDQTCQVLRPVSSSISDTGTCSDGQVSQEIDQTSNDLLSACSLNYSSDQTSQVLRPVSSSNSGTCRDGQVSLEIDQTSEDLPSVCSSNYGSDEQVRLQIDQISQALRPAFSSNSGSVDQTSQVLRPVDSSNYGSDGQVLLEIDHTSQILRPVGSSGSDGQVLLEIDHTSQILRPVSSSNSGTCGDGEMWLKIDQTSQVLPSVCSSNSGSQALRPVGSSNSGTDGKMPLEIDQTCQVLPPISSSNSGTDGQVPLEANINRTPSVPVPMEVETVEVISSNLIGDGQVPLVVDTGQTQSVIAPADSSISTTRSDVQLPLLVDISQTRHAPVVSSNSVNRQVGYALGSSDLKLG